MIGWIDGTAGASGDMLLGALVDAGVSIDVFQAHVDSLDADLDIALRSERVHRAGLAATKVHVDVGNDGTERHLADVVALLAPLPDAIRIRAVAVFERLAHAEAAVHGTSVDRAHFHEVGALDSIADVVSVCAGFVELGLDSIHCSTLSLGSGMTRGAHGPIPVPAPAVLRVLAGIAPVAAGPAPYESTTPTGAALLAEWVTTWGPMPAMVIGSVASGAGSKDTDVVANAVRLVMGKSIDGRSDSHPEATIIQLDANVDDLDPRVWPEAIAAALGAGAVDAWVAPIVMKKGRPAHTFSALCSGDDAEKVADAIFSNTSTLGIRSHAVERFVLDREESSVEVDGETIRVKVASRNGNAVNRSLEWDDVVAAARALGRPPNDVLTAATRLL